MRSRIIVILALVCLIVIPGYAQLSVGNDLARTISHECDHNINEFILRKLKNNCIVMLADGGHGERLYLHKLVDFLNYWVSGIERQIIKSPVDEIPSNVYLVLEYDSLQIGTIKEYIATGDLNATIEPESFSKDQFTIANLEFYYDLRTLVKRIRDLNTKLSDDRKIHFDVFGPEKVINLAQWSYEKRDSFYILERDEYSSNKVVELLEANPGSKAIVFYGAAHLNKLRAVKRGALMQGGGYYLAYYLNERFRDEGGLYTLQQRPVSYYCQLSEAFREPDSSYAVDRSLFIGRAIPFDLSNLVGDGIVVWLDKDVESKPVKRLWTERFIDLILQNIDRYKDYSNPWHQGIIGQFFVYLNLVDGSAVETVDFKDRSAVEKEIVKWKTWHETTKVDIVASIENLDLWTAVIDNIVNAQVPYALSFYEGILGFRVAVHDSTSATNRKRIYLDALNRYRKQIVTENLIYVLWVGSESEKKRARTILLRETGQTFDTAKEWLLWFYALGP